MTQILISFLGRGNAERGNRYRPTTYDFGEGNRLTTEFFGLGLTQALQPDRLLILGTTGSMWDVLLISLGLGEAQEEALLDLTESADADCTTQAQLDQLAPLVSECLGLPVTLQLIPYGRDMAEQIDILQRMVGHIREGDQVSLDVTHGLRHLPMLTLVSAIYLQAAFKVMVKGIYYGALDMTRDKLTPVMHLDGLLNIVGWVAALHTFDKDGDYSVFADLLEQDGLSLNAVNHLRKAAYFERTFNVTNARTQLLGFAPSLNAGLPGIGRLFDEQLRARTEWHKGSDTYARQRELAYFYLRQRDYPRAAIFAFEAFLTHLVARDAGEREFDYDDRDHAESEFRAGNRGNPSLRKSFQRLEKLRNTLAHGNPSKDQQVQGIVKDENRLHQELLRLMDRLLG